MGAVVVLVKVVMLVAEVWVVVVAVTVVMDGGDEAAVDQRASSCNP
jgi:hypothetical protein